MEAKGHQPIRRAMLMDAVWARPLAAVADELGMTANGLAKLCDRLAIPRPGRRYWHLPPAARAGMRPSLPPAPADAGEDVVLGGPRRSRRTRTRLSPDDRREQLLDAAAAIAVEEGVAEVSMNRVARAVDISEAQAHNCFGRRIDLLVALARRELAAMERTRRKAVSRGDDMVTSVVLSTLFYLEDAEARGPLLHALLRVPEIERALRDERDELRRRERAPLLASMQARYGMTEGEARGANAILTAVVQRAGAMLASRRAGHALITRMTLSIVLAGMRSNAGGRLPEGVNPPPGSLPPTVEPAPKGRHPATDR